MLCQFLEHILGSQSAVATIGHAVTTHTLDMLTLALLAFWALSPLGGQSVLRLLHETNSTIVENRPVFYAKVNAQSDFNMAVHRSDSFNRANAVVNSALMTSETLEWTPVDTWNHPKIPRIDELEIAALENSTDRSWYTVNPNGNYSYASLAGVNIVNLSERGSTNLTVPYEYMYFDCEMSSKTKFHNFFDNGAPQPEPTLLRNYLSELGNRSKLTTDDPTQDPAELRTTPSAPFNISRSFFADNSFFMYSKGTGQKNEALLYGSRYTGTTRFFLWECSMNSVMVEANIVCQSDKCGVDRVRRIVKPFEKYIAYRTPYGVAHSRSLSPMFIQAIAWLGGKTTMYRPNPVDAYIYGQAPWAEIPEGKNILYQNWTEYVTGPRKRKDMSRRLTKVLNTYLDASRWGTAVTQRDPFGKKSFNGTGLSVDDSTTNSTEAVVTLLTPVYKVHAPWAALLVISSVVLLLLSIFGILVQLRTVAPDIFNHVSSLTRDNPHVHAPAGGSGLDGADRARYLKDMRVQLGDAEPQSKAGYVAFRSIDGVDDCREGRIRKERMYR